MKKGKKVAFFVNNLNYGGAEQFVYSLCDIHAGKFGIDQLVIIAKGGSRKTNLQNEGFTVKTCPMIRIGKDKISNLPLKQKLFMRFWLFLRPLYFVLLKNELKGVRLIVSQHGFPTILADYLSKKLNIKHVNIVHHILPNEYTDIYKNVSCCPDKYIAVSEEVQRFLLETKGVEPVELVKNPIVKSANGFREHKTSSRVIVTLVSHVHVDKRDSIYALIDFAKLCSEKVYDISIRIAGDYSNDFGLDVKKKFGENVEFLGALSKAALENAIHESDLIIGVGRSALEAAIMRRSVIVCGHVKGVSGGNYAGLLTPNNFAEVSYYNYSGRNSAIRSSGEQIYKDFKLFLEEPIDIREQRLEKLFDLVNKYHSPNNVHDEIVVKNIE